MNPLFTNEIYLSISTQYIFNLYRYTQIYNVASHDNDRSAGLAAVSSNCYASDNAATPGRVLPKNANIDETHCKISLFCH